MPGGEVGVLGFQRQADPGGEVHGRKGADVGHGEGLAGDEGAGGQFAVEPGLGGGIGFAVRLAEVLELGEQGGGAGVGVAPEGAHRGGEHELHPTHPHLDPGLFQGRDPEERRIGLDRLEIAADGHGLGDGLAVVEFQGRDLAQGIAGAVLGRLVLPRAKVERRLGQVDPLFGQEDAHPARIGGRHRRAVGISLLGPPSSNLAPAPPRGAGASGGGEGRRRDSGRSSSLRRRRPVRGSRRR